MGRQNIPLEFTRGDDVSKTFAWRRSGGTDLIPLTGRTYASQIRQSLSDDTAPFYTFEVDYSLVDTGKVRLFMPKEITISIEPGPYYWDIEETIMGLKTTPVAGKCVVWPDATK